MRKEAIKATGLGVLLSLMILYILSFISIGLDLLIKPEGVLRNIMLSGGILGLIANIGLFCVNLKKRKWFAIGLAIGTLVFLILGFAAYKIAGPQFSLPSA